MCVSRPARSLLAHPRIGVVGLPRLLLPGRGRHRFGPGRGCRGGGAAEGSALARLADRHPIAGLAAAATHSAALASASRFGSIALLFVIGARIASSGPARILALFTLASIMAGLFGGELLDPLGIPGIWFPFGIGVSRTQYLYAIVIPLVAVTFVQTLRLDGRGGRLPRDART